MVAAIKGRDQPGPSHPRLGLTTNPAPDPASDATGRDTGQKQAQTHGPTRAGPPCGHWGHWKVDYPTSSQNSSPTLRELFHSIDGTCVPDTSSELRLDEIVAGRKVFLIVDTGATFSLVTSYSGPTQNSELISNGVSGVPLSARISFPLLLSIWKLDPHTLISHNASVPHGAPRERFVIQIRGLYYHTPPLDTVSIFCMKMAPGPSLSPTLDLPLDLLAVDPQV